MANAFQKAIKNNSTAPPPAKAKSQKNKVFVAVSDDVKEAVDNFVDAAKKMKQAKADMAFNETTISDAVREIQDTDGFNNQYQKSYDVPGNNESVKYVSKNQASINSEDADTIQKLLGNDYEFLMQENMTVTLKAEVFADDKKQEELMNLLGEKFGEFFNVETKLALADDYDKNIFGIVKNQAELDKVRTYIKMYKAALRG